MPKFKVFLVVVFFHFCNISSTYAQAMAPQQIDSLVESTRKAFDIPGIAVSIVKDGKVIFAKGYGVASLNSRKKVDENTLFSIASNTKAFTTAAIGILSDEGKLKLDDKVTDYIPEFKLYDPYVTSEFTIRDLLTHRSGLGLGAGDLMFLPDSSDFTVKDIIYNLRFLKPVSGFRTKFDYDNQMYIVAGEIIARVSGVKFEDFIETRILKPMQMNNSAASYSGVKNSSNIVDPHAVINGKIVVIPRFIDPPDDPAGGIYSSIADMSKWIIMQMNDGKYGESLNKQLFSSAFHTQMWTPQTIVPAVSGVYNTHFSAYGLGWFLSDVKGYKQVEHNGAMDGMVTDVTLLPELKLGIVVLTNQQSGSAIDAITNQIKDSFLGLKGNDWVKKYADLKKGENSTADSITAKAWAQINKQLKQ